MLYGNQKITKLGRNSRQHATEFKHAIYSKFTMNLDLMHWNINGYYSKLPHLQLYLDEKTPKIICLQETWLKTENNIYLRGPYLQ